MRFGKDQLLASLFPDIYIAQKYIYIAQKFNSVKRKQVM